jgi:Fur family ferric uptake transcriptional regulator
VYRALQYLERAGAADVVRDDVGERLYRHRPGAGHRHYLICRRCRRNQLLDADVVERWVAEAVRSTGFAEVEHTLELTGICGGCRSGADDP